MLDNLKMIHQRDAQDALGLAEKQWQRSDVGDFLRAEVQTWLPAVPTKHNMAKEIALECIGKSIVVYASPLLATAAQHWKTGFNEHARQLAWVGDLNPSELVGWTKQPVVKTYGVIELLSDLEPLGVQQAFTSSARLLSGLRPEPLRVHAVGKTPSEQLAWSLNLGDFVTIYTALLNGLNPTPVELIEKFKKLMEDPE